MRERGTCTRRRGHHHRRVRRVRRRPTGRVPTDGLRHRDRAPIDATLVRLLLIPAAMALLGERNWHLPRWLDWLPQLQVEGAPPDAPQPAKPGTENTPGPGASARPPSALTDALYALWLPTVTERTAKARAASQVLGRAGGVRKGAEACRDRKQPSADGTDGRGDDEARGGDGRPSPDVFAPRRSQQRSPQRSRQAGSLRLLRGAWRSLSWP